MARQMKKSTTSAEETEVIIDNDVEESIPKKTYRDGDYILCRSIIAGGLNINCRSGNYYRFNNYGDYSEIEYRDLVELIRKHSDHIFLPRIIIEEEDFLLNFPQIKNVYANMYTVGDLKEILSMPEAQLRATVNSLPDELKTTLKSMAATMVENGEIDSISRVRILTEILDADFNFLSELFSSR